MARITTLLFDVDGTLIDSNDFHVEAWQRVLREAGHDFPAAAIHAHVGKGGDNLVPSLLPDLPQAEQDRLAAAHGPLYKRDYINRVKPFPGARDLLVRARGGALKVALATSAAPEELRHYVRLLDAENLIDVTTDKGDVESTKPAPDIFATAARKAGARPDEALAIGDSPYDVLAAERAGIGTIGLLSGGFLESELREAGALAIYEGAADLLARWDSSPICHAS